ncbi:hypothetical protein RN001_015158 [Aquatica leii]|uniref:Reverse transcriptase domain-containing protein n=1 Tax=Aquatica leii TaxID=1421715 RepID=A0AAN7NYV8_9COLE|nr:hypothetical protein RN001_015158 [Aquatica leii]
MNGRVGKALDSKIVGRHGEDAVNDNGTRWIELCEQHTLKILNGQTTMDENKQKGIKAKIYNLEGLKNESTSFLYKLRLAQKLNAEISGTAENMYEKLKGILQDAASEALGTREKRKTVNYCQIHTILFADDQIVMAEDCQDITYMLNKLIEEYKNWGLEVNKEKTQYMVIGGAGADMELDSGIIKGVKPLHPVLWNKNFTVKTKQNIYKTMIESVMTYGSETWVMDKNSEQKLLSAEMSRRMSAKSTIVDNIYEKQLKWYGHLRRMSPERIPMRIWNWTPPQRNKRGRPRKKWIKNVNKEMEKRELQEGDWNDKDRWRLGCEKRQ